MFPLHRPRRLRANETIRRMVRETSLSPDDFIYPLFVTYGKGVRKEIPSMPGCFQESLDVVTENAKEIRSLGIPSIILFGIPEHKDETGSGAYDDQGIVQNAIRAIKNAVPELYVITDVCMCEYTSHGHCGLIEEGDVSNDPTLELLAKEALSHVRAGADMVAPSDMMDGRVEAIRLTLDEEGFSKIPIMSYAAKYASAFYGPFREAAGSFRSQDYDVTLMEVHLNDNDKDKSTGNMILGGRFRVNKKNQQIEFESYHSMPWRLAGIMER